MRSQRLQYPEGDREVEGGDKDTSPHSTQSSGIWKRQETGRWACWEGFLSGRRRARAADEPHRSSERPEPDTSMPLGDLGGFEGLRGHREDCCGGQCLRSGEQSGGDIITGGS